jgi:hypothetical protein
MKRALLAGAVTLIAGCAAESSAPVAPMSPQSSPAPAAEPAPLVAKPKPQIAPSLVGAIGGRPFVAASALMVVVNRPMRACSTKLTGTGSCSTDTDGFDVSISSLRIYERPLGCADLGDELRRREVRLTPGERVIELEIQGRWPLAAGSTWKVDRDGPPDPRSDYVQSATFRFAGAQTNALGYGQVRFGTATPTDGTIVVELTALSPEAGAVRGTVPFTVCSPR